MPDSLPLASEWVVLAGRLATIETNLKAMHDLLVDFINVQRRCNEVYDHRHDAVEQRLAQIDSELSSVKTKLAVAGMVAAAALIAMIGIVVDMLTHGGKFIP